MENEPVEINKDWLLTAAVEGFIATMILFISGGVLSQPLLALENMVMFLTAAAVLITVSFMAGKMVAASLFNGIKQQSN